MECVLQFQSKVEYGSVEKAMSHEDGFAAIALWFDIEDSAPNTELEALMRNLPRVKHRGDSVPLPPIQLDRLLPGELIIIKLSVKMR